MSTPSITAALIFAALVAGHPASSPASATVAPAPAFESISEALVALPAYLTLPTLPALPGVATDVATGFESCRLVIGRWGPRPLIHDGPASFLDGAMAVRTCEVAVVVAYKSGLRGDVVKYVVASWGIQESNWAAAAQGDNTELGPLQIKVNTCSSRDSLGRPCHPKDGVVMHLTASIRYLDYMRQFGNGSWAEALSAYRVGPGGWVGVTDCMSGDKVCEPIDEVRRVQGQEYASDVWERVLWLEG